MKDIDKRIAKITGNLSAKELALVHVDEALTSDSLTELLEYLGAHPEVLDSRMRALSASVPKLRARHPVPSEFARELRRANYVQDFLRHLWLICNEHVFDENQKIRQRLCQSFKNSERVVGGDCAPELLDFRSEVEDLLGRVLTIDSAISTVRERHFEGHKIIFKQYADTFDVLLPGGVDAARLYNQLILCSEQMHPGDNKGQLIKVDVDAVKREAQQSAEGLVKDWEGLAKLKAMRPPAALGEAAFMALLKKLRDAGTTTIS